MEQPPVDVVNQRRRGDGAVRVPRDVATGMLPHVLEAQPDEGAPVDRFPFARAAVVDGQVPRLVRPDPPGGDQHQIYDHVDGDEVGRLVLVAEHRPEETLPGGGDDPGRSVPVVDPTLQRSVDRADDDARPHDDQWKIPPVLSQPRLGQRLRERVRVRPVADQAGRERVDQRLVQRLDELDDLIGSYRGRVHRLPHHAPVAVAVGGGDVHEGLEVRHALAELDQALCAEHVDRDGQFEFFVEFDCGGAVENDVDGLGELEAVGGADRELRLGDVALDRVDLAQVGGALLADRVEELEVKMARLP